MRVRMQTCASSSSLPQLHQAPLPTAPWQSAWHINICEAHRRAARLQQLRIARQAGRRVVDQHSARQRASRPGSRPWGPFLQRCCRDGGPRGPTRGLVLAEHERHDAAQLAQRAERQAAQHQRQLAAPARRLHERAALLQLGQAAQGGLPQRGHSNGGVADPVVAGQGDMLVGSTQHVPMRLCVRHACAHRSPRCSRRRSSSWTATCKAQPCRSTGRSFRRRGAWRPSTVASARCASTSTRCYRWAARLPVRGQRLPSLGSPHHPTLRGHVRPAHLPHAPPRVRPPARPTCRTRPSWPTHARCSRPTRRLC